MEYKDKFLDYLQYEKRYSPYTFKFYKRDLEEFEQFLEMEMLDKVSNKTIKSYMYFLTKKGNTRRTIARKLSSLKTFYKYLRKNELSEEDPFALIEKQHISKRLPEVLSINEIVELMEIEIADKDYLNNRNYLIVRILFSTGVRVSELTNIKLEHIDFNEGYLKVRGKGDKDRVVFFDEDTKNILYSFLQNNWAKFKKDETNYVFLNKFGNKISERSVELILQEKGRKMKSPKEIYPHMLRHSYASSLLESGADLRVIQELLGHASLQATQVYTSLSNQKLQKNYLESHPHSKK